MSPCPCCENHPVPPRPWSLLYAGHHVQGRLSGLAGPGVSPGTGVSEGPSHIPIARSITAVCPGPWWAAQPTMQAEVGRPVYPAWGGYLVGLSLHCPAADRTPLPCPAGPRERHGPSTPGGQLPGARRGPGPRRPAPLPAQPPGALGGVLRPLRTRPACCPGRPRPVARRLPLRPHRPARRHRRPGGPPLAWGSPQPAPRPTTRRSSAFTLARGAAPGIASAERPGGPGGRPHPSGPGSPGGGGAVGPRDRGPAAADGGRPQRAVRAAETRGAAATPPLALESPVQSHHGTPALPRGPRSPRGGAQLGACTRPVDVGDSGGQDPPNS